MHSQNPARSPQIPLSLHSLQTTPFVSLMTPSLFRSNRFPALCALPPQRHASRYDTRPLPSHQMDAGASRRQRCHTRDARAGYAKSAHHSHRSRAGQASLFRLPDHPLAAGTQFLLQRGPPAGPVGWMHDPMTAAGATVTAVTGGRCGSRRVRRAGRCLCRRACRSLRRWRFGWCSSSACYCCAG